MVTIDLKSNKKNVNYFIKDENCITHHFILMIDGSNMIHYFYNTKNNAT
jgi:hypothetical protein